MSSWRPYYLSDPNLLEIVSDSTKTAADVEKWLISYKERFPKQEKRDIKELDYTLKVLEHLKKVCDNVTYGGYTTDGYTNEQKTRILTLLKPVISLICSARQEYYTEVQAHIKTFLTLISSKALDPESEKNIALFDFFHALPGSERYINYDDIIYEENSPLTNAIQSKNARLTQHLLRLPKLKVNFKTVFKQIIDNNFHEGLQVLLSLKSHHEINYNLIIEDELTPLMYAIKNKANNKLIELLVNDPRVNINLKTKSGQTALHLALYANPPDTDLIEILLHANPDLQAIDQYGNSAWQFVNSPRANIDRITASKLIQLFDHYEKNKKEKRRISSAEKQARSDEQFALRQEKKKEKHRGH